MSTQTLPERTGVVTFRGGPMTLVGPALAKGDAAPAFNLTASGLTPFALDDATAKGTRAALIITVPSLDTPTCSVETSTFHKRLAELPSNVAAFIVSADLPFAQSRWAEANEAGKLTYLSDYRGHTFAPSYGVLIKELDLLARAIFIVAPNGKIAYAQIVKEIATEPNYDEVFAAAKSV
ncbi:MAG: thiol peroxidase [Vulcanimicrobiaceae bacterium]